MVTDEELLLQGDEDCWISPPDSLYTNDSESDFTSSDSHHQDDSFTISNDWDFNIKGTDKAKFSEGIIQDSSRFAVNEDTVYTSPSFFAHSQEDPLLAVHIQTEMKFEGTEDSDSGIIPMGNSEFHSARDRSQSSQVSINSNKVSSDSQNTTDMNLSDMGLGSLNAFERHQTYKRG